jgi:hypothetical protein
MEVIGFFLGYPIVYVAIWIASFLIFCIPSLFVWNIIESCFNGNVYQIYYESDQTILYLENQIKKLDRVYDDEVFDAVNKIMIKEKRQQLENYKREQNIKLCCKGLDESIYFFPTLSPVVIGIVSFCMNWNHSQYGLGMWLFVLPLTFISTWIFIAAFGTPIFDLLDFLFRKLKMRCTNWAS